MSEWLSYSDEPDDEPTELDLVYVDLKAAQDLIADLLAALSRIANSSEAAGAYMRTVAENALLSAGFDRRALLKQGAEASK